MIYDLRSDTSILNPDRKIILVQILLSEFGPATVWRLQRRYIRIVRRLTSQKVYAGRTADGNGAIMLVVGDAFLSNEFVDLRHYGHGVET